LFADNEGTAMGIVVDINENGVLRWLLVLSITAVLTFLNYRGLDVVTEVTIFICIFSLLPFLIFCIVGAFHVDPSRWMITPPPGGLGGVDWRLLLNTFFWNINYWEIPSPETCKIREKLFRWELQLR
jgi:amino acid transporter